MPARHAASFRYAMRNLLAFSMIFAGLAGFAHAEESAFLVAPARPVEQGSGRTLWRASLTTLAVANAVDIHSSWGKYELNPVLAGPSHRFGLDGALLKVALQGGLMGAEYMLTRGRSSTKLYRVLSFINFSAAASIGATAIHNYNMPR
jgi:hypothetical protein